MLRFVLFDTTLFSDAEDVEAARLNLMWILEALCQRDQTYLQQRPSTPRLYRSGVKYEVPAQFDGECEESRVLREALGSAAKRREVAKVLDLVQQVFGGERFRDIGRILEKGAVDCDNLACWRVAELRQAGIKARPYMTHRTRPDGGTTYHALVLWPPFGSVKYETSEDPSLLLGMGGSGRTAERAEEIRKNQERCEILQKCGIGSGRTSDLEDVLEEALGLRHSSQASSGGISAVVTEIDDLLKRTL